MRSKSSDSEPLSPGSGSDVMPLTAMATPVLTAKEPLSDLFDVDNTEIHTAQGALDHFDDSAEDAGDEFAPLSFDQPRGSAIESALEFSSGSSLQICGVRIRQKKVKLIGAVW